MVKYTISQNKVNVETVNLVPIEFLGWDYLTIGALGWGQIQIANANHINILSRYPRKTWMLELCDAVLAFYPREIAKIADRIGYMENVRKNWEERSD